MVAHSINMCDNTNIAHIVHGSIPLGNCPRGYLSQPVWFRGASANVTLFGGVKRP